MRITEYDVIEALRLKHETKNNPDIFANHVKLGPAGNKIIDAVAIPTTWSPRTIIGYEVKISRADFLRDQKHPVYMDNTNIFYFVTTPGVATPEEVPEGCGLLIFSPDTRKIRTVKKAPFRETPINPNVLLHLMFWKLDRYMGHRTRAEMLADYQAKQGLKEISIEITRKISKLESDLRDRKDGYYKTQYERIQKELKEKFGTAWIPEIPNSNGLTDFEVASLKRAYENIGEIIKNKEGKNE